MSMFLRQWQPRTTLLSAIIFFSAAYASCMSALHLAPASVPSMPSSSSGPISSVDVPDAVFQALQMHLTDLPDLQEWAVLPADSGQGYSVTATVELATNGALGQDDETVDKDMMAFFQGVYSSGVNVQDAKVYFLQDGRPVAGAGVGQAAYQKLGVTASTSPQTFADVIATQPIASDSGPEDCWFETALDTGAGDTQ